MNLLNLIRDVQKETQKVKDKFNDMLLEYVSNLDTKDGFIQADEDAIAELQKQFDAFYKKVSRPFIAFMALKIKRALRLAMEEMDGDITTVTDMEKLIGIDGDKVKKNAVGKKRTVLFAIGAMTAVTSDLLMLSGQAFNGEVKRKDYRRSLLRRANRRFHDFVEVYAIAAITQSYSAVKITYAKKQGYKKFRYVGGLVDESREFCVQRAGHEFFIEQGEEWNDLWWKGKIEGVDFFVQIGGYNCGHYLEFIK